jgi:hypothetical protein
VSRIRPGSLFRFARVPSALVVPALLCLLCFSLSTRAQEQSHSLLSIDDDCSAFAFAPDDRVVCGARRLISARHYDFEHDDIWLASLSGKKRKIVDGARLVKTENPFSYSIRAFAWSGDGRRLAVEMDTVEVTGAQSTQERTRIELMDDSGNEIDIAGTKSATGAAVSFVDNALQPAWLNDNQALVYLQPSPEAKGSFTLNTLRPADGTAHALFSGHQFAAVAWDLKRNAAVAIEDAGGAKPKLQLVKLNLANETLTNLAILGASAGGLTVSPSGTNVGWFPDRETFEALALGAPDRTTRLQALFGTYSWSLDERRILLKPGPANKSNEIVWVGISNGNSQPILHGLPFRSFAISPDFKYLGVSLPGKRVVMVYPLPE